MFSKEKFKIKVTLFVRAFVYHLVFWTLTLFLYIFLTGDSSLFVNYLNLLKVDSIYTNTLLFSFALASIFTLSQTLFVDSFMRMRIVPIRIVMFLRSVLNFILALAIIIISVNPQLNVFQIRDWDSFLALLPNTELNFIRFVVYFFIATRLNTLYEGMFRKIGQSNISKWVFGTLNKPREETRIFMFVDMKDSTKNAESLGHRKFSHLVQDVFNDMSIIDNYHGEIYQYLGDGAIISWSVRKGITDQNCIRAFFAFQKVIDRRSWYFNRKYGVEPKFKAGIHVGKTMVLQVGKVRRDISYNGDTLNTTARIESMCNVYRQSLLISGVLYEKLDQLKAFNTKEVGNIKLKGKKKSVLIYQVKPKAKKKIKL